MIQQFQVPSHRPIVPYIREALKGAPVPPPDKHEFGKDIDAAISIYQAFGAAGPIGVMRAYEVLKATRPDIVTLVQKAEERLLIHADELKNLSSPTYLLSDYPLYTNGFNVLVGPSGSGKSFIALDAAGRLAKEKPVVYVAGEGLSGYAARWEAWKDFHQVDQAELYFYTAALQVMEQAQLHQFVELLSSHAPWFVIIDTLARSAVGVDENSAKEIGEFVGACDYIRVQLDAAVLVVHHTGKNNQIRGSSALYAAADSVMSVQEMGDRRALYNDSEHGGKNKHAAPSDPRFFYIKGHEVDGFNGAVLVEAEAIAKEPVDQRVTPTQKQILEVLMSYDNGLAASAVIDATNLAKATVYRNLGAATKAGYVLKDEDDRYTLTDKGMAALEY